MLSSACKLQEKQQFSLQGEKGLKDFFRHYFTMGVAIRAQDLRGQSAQLLKQQFGSITAENAMKMARLQPQEGVFDWAEADSIVAFALKNKIKLRGHNLFWPEHLPEWFLTAPPGQELNKNLLLQRLRKHILAVVGRYKGKIYAWDVVNEAVADDAQHLLRPGLLTQIGGQELIAKAFEYAHEADPKALLFYNDYDLEKTVKRDKIIRLLQDLKSEGTRIDGVGMQAHWDIYNFKDDSVRRAIEALGAANMKIHITELDVSVYPWEFSQRAKNSDEIDSYTPDLEQKQTAVYRQIFQLFRHYTPLISSVSFWGLSDSYTWLDYFPVRGRKNYPLLFDENLQPKKAYWEIIQPIN